MTAIPIQQPGGETPDSEPPDVPGGALVETLYCDGCERMAPGPDCWRSGRYVLCRRCQEEYITAWAMGRRITPGQYVRDKRFGDEEAYALSG
ncbi:MAG TPA: hypothetical protein VFD32_15935 [Dehalococcoidia bacterium]|nr:hypothetical protein [Dehalococcoidia bacterium]